MGKKRNGCLIVFIVFIALIALLLWLAVCPHTKRSIDIDLYRALSGEISGPNALDLNLHLEGVPCPYDLPQLGELEPYEDYRYQYTLMYQAIFAWDAHCLIVSYDEAQYAVQKAALEDRYLFHDAETIQAYDGDMPWYEDTADGFQFRVVQGGYYPKEMFFLGFGDEKQEIAIVYFYDIDLDYVDDPLAEFLKENTGWERIVK